MPRLRSAKGDGSVYFDASKSRWVAKIPYADPLTGRLRYRKPTFATEAEAKAAKRDAIKLRDRGRETVPLAGVEDRLDIELTDEAKAHRPGTFGRLYLALLQGPVRAELAPHSYDCRLSRARKHILPLLGGLTLSRVDPVALSGLFSRLAKAGAGVPTRTEVRRDLHAFFERIGPDGLALVDRNPVTKAHRFERHEQRTKRILEVSECARVVQTIVGLVEDGELPAALESVAGMTVLSLGTGARRGECVALRWGNWKGELLTLDRAASRATGKGLFEKDPKTHAGRRAMPVPATLAHLLGTLKARTSSLYCFPNPEGGPLDLRAVNREFEALKDLLDLPEAMVFNDLRSTFRSVLDGRVPGRALMELMGHTKESTGSQHYARGLDADKRAAGETIEALWG